MTMAMKMEKKGAVADYSRQASARDEPMDLDEAAPQGGGGAAGYGGLAGGDVSQEEAERGGGVGGAAGIEPSDAWLDFDALVLARPEDRARRGRLVRRAEPSMANASAAAYNALERMEVPAGLRDPRETRGQFDHRYDARGTADVPSSGTPHRITVGSAQAAPTVRLRVVPREATEVYREAEMKNPFDAPLLAGPVDVFLDGALMTSSALGAVDRGGMLTLGLGAEDRVRAARNARADESNAGLLGGSTVIDHAVTIDLTSSLGHPIAVQVLDRVPVSDDKSVEVTLTGSHPVAEAYDQAERGAPVRGGLRWRLELPAGAKSRIEFRYRVALPAKSEVVGGNRRD
jgi:uncharacterized protein (TIGR02231 family)